MNEVWIHGNDWSDENIHDDSGVRVVWYEHYQALEAERDRYMAALETIELMDPDWTLGVDENMSRLQSIAGRALKAERDHLLQKTQQLEAERDALRELIRSICPPAEIAKAFWSLWWGADSKPTVDQIEAVQTACKVVEELTGESNA